MRQVSVLHVRRRFDPAAGVSAARLIVAGMTINGVIGRSGLRRGKREGDGGTPCGVFRLLPGYFRRAPGLLRPPACFPMVATRCDDGWCDDPASPLYNRPVRLPVRAGHERMWREDGLYDIVIPLDYNMMPRKSGAGSAIFFHLCETPAPGAAPKPTAGCVAIPAAAMRRLLPRLGKRAVMVIG